ncbi:hypothetical protein BTA35_0216445 [Oceanospirillum linum]|uniref:Uncharacterized protein n=1 Tax=Oceanospirillum linum TaxID=966 RepID=A0A1T1H7T6_OCELI|nr:hypothetical protein [Oceanospirillum linum]OOV85855.1 hypothetical protein BTA35_0216445 [Oceanospirillum linum]
MMKEFTIVKNGERVFDRTQGKYVTSNPTKTQGMAKLNYLNLSKTREIFGDIERMLLLLEIHILIALYLGILTIL